MSADGRHLRGGIITLTKQRAIGRMGGRKDAVPCLTFRTRSSPTRAKAREWLEARVWPHGPVCPHCGVTDEHVTKLEGGKHRPGALPVQRMPRAVHRHRQDRIRAQQNPAHQVACRAVPADRLARRAFRAHQVHRSLGHQLQVGVVHDASPA